MIKVLLKKNQILLIIKYFPDYLLVGSFFTLTRCIMVCSSQDLVSIIRFCLEEAEKLQMRSLSFPAIGTGQLGFPRDVVSRVLLREIRSFSRRRAPRHLREVFIVVHPGDRQTEDVSWLKRDVSQPYISHSQRKRHQSSRVSADHFQHVICLNPQCCRNMPTCLCQCFTREFKGQPAQKKGQGEASEFESAAGQSYSQSQPSAGETLQLQLYLNHDV